MLFSIESGTDVAIDMLMQVVVLEGKYWKRSNEVVKNEYMKWRVFYKERMKYWQPDKEVSVCLAVVR